MQLSEWISILHEHHITETDTLDLFNTAVFNYAYADKLTPILMTLQKLGGDVNTDFDLYSAVMNNPERAENILVLIETLGEIGALLIEDYDLYMAAIRLADEKPRLMATINLLKQHHLEFPEFAQLYHVAITTPFSTLETILRWLDDFGAILPQDSWLYSLAFKNASFIVSRTNIFALFKQRGITSFRNGALVEAVLQQYYQPEQILKSFDTLDSLGLNLITDEEFYVAATGWLVSSEFINPAFDSLRALGANLGNDPELFKAALKSCSFIRRYTPGFTALKNAGIGFSAANKALYLDCLENPDTADQLEQGFAFLAQSGIDYTSYPLLYQNMVKHSGNISAFVKTCSMFRGIGALLPDCESLYLEAMKHKVNHFKLAHGLAALVAFDFSLPADKAIFEKIIFLSHYADQLYSILQVLKDRGIVRPGNQEIVLATIDALPNLDALDKVMSWFKKMNVNGAEHPELYLAAIKNLRFSDSLLDAWDLLHEAGFGMESKEMYLLAAGRIHEANQLDNALTTLLEQGAHAPDHKDLFTAVIEQAHFGEFFQADCILLSSMDINVIDWDFLYVHVAKYSSSELTEILQSMLNLNFNMTEHSELIKAILLDNRYNTSLDALAWLEERGLRVRNHPKIYNMFFLHKPCLCSDPYILKKAEDAVELYLQDNPLIDVQVEGFVKQNQKIEEIIAAVVNKQNEITQGPLGKSAATVQFEQILKKLASLSLLSINGIEPLKQLAVEQIQQINMTYDSTYGYVLTLDNEVIYLNELMRLVNFSHLELDKEQHIIPLGKLLEQIVPEFNQHYLDKPHVVLSSLPLVIRQALYLYTTWYYRNINRTFRGLEQNTEEKYVWIEPVNGRENLLANFLCGCLVNWAAAELPRALVDLPERQILKKIMLNEVKRFKAEHGTTNMDVEKLLHRMKTDERFFDELLLNNLSTGFITEKEHASTEYITEKEHASIAPLFDQLDLLFPRYAQVIRVENIQKAEQEGHFNVRKVREANPVHLPSVMSTSSSKVSDSLVKGEERTLFAPESFDHTPILSRDENELLSPLGSSFLYSSNTQNVFFAREVNSPNIVPNGGYWSSLALIEANKNHLQYTYKEITDEAVVDGIWIARANHGFPHGYRKALHYIDMVIEYYSLHAQDDEFKYFCQQISFREREWLRVAIAYRVTGRESELGASENLARYEMYREASCAHLDAFLKKYPAPFHDPAMTQRMMYLIRWMGNPFFETGIMGDPSDGQMDEKERQYRNFLNRILSTTHNLDLARCHRPEEFEQGMSICRESSRPGEQQQQDYNRMIRYATELIRAHGDRLRTDINAEGELIDGEQEYCSPFGAVQKLRVLHEVSRSVSRPKFEKIDMEEVSLVSPIR